MTNEVIADINLNAIKSNFEFARSLASASRIMAVIKADAYGHGAIETARALPSVNAFAVARMSEAIVLREAGIEQPICLLEGVLVASELNEARQLSLDIVVHGAHQLELLKGAGDSHRVWVKVDTGMGRLGFNPEETNKVLTELAEHNVLGVMTHFARADESDINDTGAQMARLPDVGETDLSIANSAGIIAHPETRSAWVRPGLMLYGANPLASLTPLPELASAMSLSAPVISVRKISKGESVGYGGIWVADEDSKVAVVAIGYADGYPREISSGTSVLSGGERREIVGRVSMDMICVKLSANDGIKAGDRVLLWGADLPIEEIAARAGTVPYTLMCGVGKRVVRRYSGALDGEN